jgi:hypothetical protein
VEGYCEVYARKGDDFKRGAAMNPWPNSPTRAELDQKASVEVDDLHNTLNIVETKIVQAFRSRVSLATDKFSSVEGYCTAARLESWPRISQDKETIWR